MKTYNVDEATKRKIEKSFTYHAPKPDQIPRYESLRDSAKTLADQVNSLVPPGREQSVAITKLEECIMWANKGIAVGEAE